MIASPPPLDRNSHNLELERMESNSIFTAIAIPSSRPTPLVRLFNRMQAPFSQARIKCFLASITATYLVSKPWNSIFDSKSTHQDLMLTNILKSILIGSVLTKFINTQIPVRTHSTKNFLPISGTLLFLSMLVSAKERYKLVQDPNRINSDDNQKLEICINLAQGFVALSILILGTKMWSLLPSYR